MAKIKFPQEFWWGSATSGPQTEGNSNMVPKSDTIWDKWYKQDEEKFFKREFVKGNLIERYEEYTKWAEYLNFNSIRISIQWARFMPDGININQKAVEFYRNYIHSFRKKNIKVIVNIHHFDLPVWADEIGGWTNRDVVDKYAKYAEKVVDKLGDLVDIWMTFNEPIVFVEAGYWFKWWYPLEVNMKKGLQVLWNQLIAHCKVVKIFKEKYPNKKIGAILNLTPAIPRSNSIEDIKAAKWCELFQAKSYLDPMIKGIFPKEIISEAKDKGYMWEINPTDYQLIKNNTIKFLGINFYQPLRVKAPDQKINPKNIANPHNYYLPYLMPNRRVNKYRGWEIYPKAIYMAIKNIQNNYGNIEVYIAENGMGVENEKQFNDKNGQIHDTYRIDFLSEHLFWVHKAIKEGANCIGYHMWTYIDNWSWINAYKNRYGFISFNTQTGKLTPKYSAEWIKKVIQRNEVEWNG